MGYSRPLLSSLADRNSFSSVAASRCLIAFFILLSAASYWSIISMILFPFSRQTSLHISGELAAILVKSRNPAPEKIDVILRPRVESRDRADHGEGRRMGEMAHCRENMVVRIGIHQYDVRTGGNPDRLHRFKRLRVCLDRRRQNAFRAQEQGLGRLCRHRAFPCPRSDGREHSGRRQEALPRSL